MEYERVSGSLRERTPMPPRAMPIMSLSVSDVEDVFASGRRWASWKSCLDSLTTRSYISLAADEAVAESATRGTSLVFFSLRQLTYPSL